MLSFHEAVEAAGLAIDAAGVFIIVAGVLFAAWRFVAVSEAQAERYSRMRHDLGRAILLGLELLVAADIIRTVALEPTLDNVLVLGVVVLIRTFLSMSLQVELEGRWPWQRVGTADEAAR
jgi:uncharacterized membrane protein